MSKAYITVYTPEKVKTALQKLAKRKGVSLNRLCAQALSTIANHPKDLTNETRIIVNLPQKGGDY